MECRSKLLTLTALLVLCFSFLVSVDRHASCPACFKSNYKNLNHLAIHPIPKKETALAR